MNIRERLRKANELAIARDYAIFFGAGNYYGLLIVIGRIVLACLLMLTLMAALSWEMFWPVIILIVAILWGWFALCDAVAEEGFRKLGWANLIRKKIPLKRKLQYLFFLKKVN